MNKIKASKREMGNNYRILSIGYCNAQYLLSYETPVAYSVGVYGWSCDYYDIDGIIISTGYSPISSKNMKEDYKLIKEYEDKARALNSKEEIQQLLRELLKKLTPSK